MRLLNVETYQLEQFLDPARPPYAILSHTWGKNETTYQDVEAGRKIGEGWNKIEACCNQAVKHGYKYVWVDTCCIDKSSSAELSEAINSMYQWYKDSKICYVYMSDVPQEEDHFSPDSAFRSSRWFSRGWTLQEFLAPRHIQFFNQSWTTCFPENLRRPRANAVLVTLLCDITTISQWAVSTGEFTAVPIAQRLSWASHRTTTRIEDTAYSLLGILGINMPLLYGEGKAAFQRLQEEVLRTKMDQSCLCWGLDISWHEMARETSHLAESPTFFRECGTLQIRHRGGGPVLDRTRLQSVTNLGVQIEVPVIQIDRKRGIWLAGLPYGPSVHYNCTAIPLHDMGIDGYYRRLEGIAPFAVPFKPFKKAAKKKICLLTDEHVNFYHPMNVIGPRIPWRSSTWTESSFRVRLDKLLSRGYRIAGYFPPQDQDSHCNRCDPIGEISYEFGTDFLFLDFTNGLSRIGVSICGADRFRSRLSVRLFRIYDGSTLAVALSVRPRRSRIWGRRKSYEERVELEECCSSSICEDSTHHYLLHEKRYDEHGWANVYLDIINGDVTT